MKKLFFLTALLLASFPALAQTETPTSPAETAPPTATPTLSIPKTVGEGSFGLGLSQISVSPYQGQSSLTNSLLLLSIRYWLSDKFILEALAGGTTGTQEGSDASGNLFGDPYWAYSYGFGVKTNLVKPFDGLWIQAVTRFLFLANSSQRGTFTDVYTDQYQYLSLSAGLGFEYFLPFVKNLSLETGVNLEFDSNWENYADTPRNKSLAARNLSPSTWVLKVVSPGFNLTSLSIHYYF